MPVIRAERHHRRGVLLIRVHRQLLHPGPRLRVPDRHARELPGATGKQRTVPIHSTEPHAPLNARFSLFLERSRSEELATVIAHNCANSAICRNATSPAAKSIGALRTDKNRISKLALFPVK